MSLSSPENPEKGSSIRKSAVVTGYFTHGSHASVHKQSQKTTFLEFCCYKFYCPSFGMAYGNPRFSELGNILTKVALEHSRMVLCSPDWEAHGGNEYWQTLLDRLTISSIRLPDEAIYVPLGRRTSIGRPGWGSMLSVADGGLTSNPMGGPRLNSGPDYTTGERWTHPG